MTHRTKLALGAGLLICVCTCVWLMVRPANSDLAPRPDPALLFREAAHDSGIHFRMNFLPSEQGEVFKVNLYDHGCGVAVGDYDGDGWDDIYFANQLGANGLYRNKGDGTFEDKTAAAGVGLGDRICVAAAFADLTNTGTQDLFVTSIRGGNVLFRNDGTGKFRDATKEAGLQHVGHCQSAHFFDFDKDGYLDLLVTCTAKWTESGLDGKHRYFPGKRTYFETAGSEKEFNKLYRNNRDGTFTDVTASSGLAGLGWAADACVFDFDGDGWPDVAVTNMFGRAQLYKNQGNETFADVTLKVLGPTSWGGMGVHPFDFNNDGKLDLFIADMHSDMWIPYDYDLATIDDKKRNKILGVPVHPDHPLYSQLVEKNRPFADLVSMRPAEVVYGNVFFKNLGQGKFQEISPSANLETFWPWGIACGDWDNDGFEDVFIPSGMGHPFAYWPNSLLMNQGNETFAERADRFGLEPPHKGYFLEEAIGGRFAPRSSRAAAVADFNKDGRLDIIVNNFNDHPYYYKNVGTKGNFVALRLQGTKSNRDAIGAVVRLYTGKDVMTRQVNPACGYLAQSSKTVHFGLGDRTKIDRITVTWPSGMEQELPALALDKLHTIQEP